LTPEMISDLMETPWSMGIKSDFLCRCAFERQNGFPLGTLCVVDHEPRTLSERQKESLMFLANQVTKLFELQSINEGLKETQKQLKEKNIQLKKLRGSRVSRYENASCQYDRDCRCTQSEIQRYFGQFRS